MEFIIGVMKNVLIIIFFQCLNVQSYAELPHTKLQSIGLNCSITAHNLLTRRKCLKKRQYNVSYLHSFLCSAADSFDLRLLLVRLVSSWLKAYLHLSPQEQDVLNSICIHHSIARWFRMRSLLFPIQYLATSCQSHVNCLNSNEVSLCKGVLSSY